MHNRLTRTAPRRAVVAFAPAALLLVFGVLLGVGYGRTLRVRDDVGRSREAALAAERVFSSLKDAESGNRGFLLIGDEQYLAPYNAALARLRSDMTTLRSLVSSDPNQARRLESVATHVEARLALLERGIALRRAGQVDAAVAIVRGGAGMEHMEQIRALMNEVVAHERAHTLASFASERRETRVLIALFAAGIVLLLALGYVVNLLLLRFGASQAAAAAHISEQHAQLQEQAGELELQRDHLHEQNVELELQQDQLQRQAVELELQHEELHANTRELMAVNARLEATNAALDTARQEAEQANRAKSQFLTAMSHELRTPLNAIGGYVDLVEAGVYGQPTQGQLDAMARVKSNHQHLLAVITDILSYAGLAAGSLRVQPESFRVAPLLADVERIIHPVARERDLALVIEPLPTGEALNAYADPARVRQIIINLLANAVKFTPAGGCITVAARELEGGVEIDVQDTGPGIQADKLAAIFEPFVQLDRSNYEEDGRGGLGLGLALSRELARGMGGDVTVRSSPGAGSVFTLRVPAAIGARVPEIA